MNTKIWVNRWTDVHLSSLFILTINGKHVNVQQETSEIKYISLGWNMIKYHSTFKNYNLEEYLMTRENIPIYWVYRTEVMGNKKMWYIYNFKILVDMIFIPLLISFYLTCYPALPCTLKKPQVSAMQNIWWQISRRHGAYIWDQDREVNTTLLHWELQHLDHSISPFPPFTKFICEERD